MRLLATFTALQCAVNNSGLAIKEGRIVEKRAISDFARRPADTYRRLRMAITYPDMDV